MGGGTGDGFGRVYRTKDGGLMFIDGCGQIFSNSENPVISEEYFKSPISKLYSTMKNYAVNIISNFKRQKDISSKL